jgi:hypothetical protein
MNSVASTLTPIDPLKPDPRARSERQAHTVRHLARLSFCCQGGLKTDKWRVVTVLSSRNL